MFGLDFGLKVRSNIGFNLYLWRFKNYFGKLEFGFFDDSNIVEFCGLFFIFRGLFLDLWRGVLFIIRERDLGFVFRFL